MSASIVSPSWFTETFTFPAALRPLSTLGQCRIRGVQRRESVPDQLTLVLLLRKLTQQAIYRPVSLPSPLLPALERRLTVPHNARHLARQRPNGHISPIHVRHSVLTTPICNRLQFRYILCYRRVPLHVPILH